MASADKELEAQLTEAGNQLLEPPSSVEDLLPLLDSVESCLSKVEQSPTKSMQTALSPSQKALVAEQLLRHSDPDVKVAVASCISEITRITAPDAPYDDDQMKEVFQLIVSSFENLYDKSSRSYAKRTSILETVAKVRSCVVMLDLECDALILEMFQHFLKSIRDYHPENVFSSMETIMTLVLEESEDISLELISPLLDSVKNDNEDILPIARKLGERVLESCATKLKPYMIEQVKCLGIALDDYSKVVASICQEAAGDDEPNEGFDADENVAAEDKSAIKESSDEAAQVDKGKAEAAVSPDQVDPAIDKSSQLVMNNGNTETGEDDSFAESNALKKQEEGDDTEDQKDPNASSNAEPDSLETQKAVDAEQIPEQAMKEKAGDYNLSTNSTEPSENREVDNEEDTETQPDHKSVTEDVPSSPHEAPSEEAAVPSEKEKGSDVNLSSKALEKESAVVASRSASESLPDESRSKKAGRNKKKDSSNKGAAAFADDEPNKATDGTSDSELKPSRRTGKRGSGGISNENKNPIVVDASRKESGTTSDSEANQKSAKKVDGSTKTDDGSSIKQPEDKKRRGRGKVTPGKDATKSSSKDDDKEMMSTPKTATKSTKDEPPLEETPKTNSKRKRASGKEKGSGAKDFGEDVVGSKIQVWWPKDRRYYKGVVDSFDPAKKKHKVLYIDGDQEVLNLKKEKWEYIEGDFGSDEEQETDQSSHDASSELPLKRKVKINAEEATKAEKMDISPKLGGASSGRSKGGATKFGRKSREGSKADSKSKGTVGKSDDEHIGKLKDHTLKSSGKSVDVVQKTSSKSKNSDSQTPKSTKSKEDDNSTHRASTKSKQDTQKAGKSNQGTPKTASISKGKSSASGGKANANGVGRVKSGSKAKDSDDIKESSSDSEKVTESTKRKSPTLSKAQGSESKSGKKRRRGTKS